MAVPYPLAHEQCPTPACLRVAQWSPTSSNSGEKYSFPTEMSSPSITANKAMAPTTQPSLLNLGPSALTVCKSPTQSPDASKETRVAGHPAEGWLLGDRSTNTCSSQLSPAFQPAPVSLLFTCHSVQAWPIRTPFNESHIEKAMKSKETSKKNPTHKNGPLM